jgi:pimeloyl-ACP methyl ester carboxylesterase
VGDSGSYVDANGVRTYYEEHGEGEPLLLMHGGFCTIETFFGQTPELAKRYRVILPERRGHGRTADVEGPITYDLMAEDTIAFMEALGVDSAHLVGYSDGANVALLVAMSRPDLVRTLVSISGNFDSDGLTEEGRARFETMQPETFIPMLTDAYKRTSPDGPEHWPVVFEKIRRMFLNEPKIAPAELAAIKAPTLVLAADRDLMTLEHTVALFRAVPNAKLCIVPGTTHALLFEKAMAVNAVLLEFLGG